MLLKQLEYFIAVVDYNSFTQAAYENYISQSAISQQVKNLEESIGTPLIVRENRKFHLTPAGVYFYQQAKQIMQHLEKSQEEAYRIGVNQRPQLSIGYLNRYTGVELAETIGFMCESNPELDITTVGGSHEELYGLLMNHEVDLILNDQWRQFSESYRNDVIGRTQSYVEVPQNYTDALTLRIQDLQRLPAILICNPLQYHTEEEYYRKVLNYTGSFIYARNLEEARLLVIARRGFVIVESLGALPSPLLSIQRIPLTTGKVLLEKNYCFFSHKDTDNTYVAAFIDTFIGLVGKYV